MQPSSGQPGQPANQPARPGKASQASQQAQPTQPTSQPASWAGAGLGLAGLAGLGWAWLDNRTTKAYENLCKIIVFLKSIGTLSRNYNIYKTSITNYKNLQKAITL